MSYILEILSIFVSVLVSCQCPYPYLCYIDNNSIIMYHRNSIIFNRGVTDVSEVCTLMQANVWS